MSGFVFHTLVSLDWTDRERYPSPLDFVTRLNDVASIDLMHSLLQDAVWNAIIQAWVITDHLSGAHTYSSHLNEAIRTLIKYRIQVVTERPIKIGHIGLYQRQINFSSDEGYEHIAFH